MGSSPALPSGVILQERDFTLLRGLFESRVMTLEHVSSLYFGGSADAAKKRVQKLKAAGIISERPRRTFDPSILVLTRVGLQPLEAQGILAEYPSFSMPALERRSRVSDRTLAHELEVVGLKAAFQAAVRGHSNLTLAEFSTWPLLNEFTTFGPRGDRGTVQPDGFLRLHERGQGDALVETSYFVEVDRSSEALELLEKKAVMYRTYYSSGGFAERCGASRAAFREHPFRVLMIFKTAERRNNTAERLLACNPPILTHVWLSTLEEVRRDPFGRVWLRPIDYREALGDWAREPAPRSRFEYRRQTERDRVVAAKLKLQSLLN